jgi:hypothetical protein
MTIKHFHELRVYDNPRQFHNAPLPVDVDAMSANLFGSFLDDNLLFEKSASPILNPLALEESEWLNDPQFSIMRNSIQPQHSEWEGFDGRFISEELVRHIISQANPTNMAFSIERGNNKLDVHAVLTAGLLTCDIKPSNDQLANRVKRLRQGLERDVSQRMRLNVEISVV